ncbi:hypothetical protein DRV85_18045 [Rhodosalinus halophilus]|uniref:Glycosyltransferase 2-like domain-containing protein n=1 Tax=Rhodosalinus halophilus TaxID=2259333 RepID=A0A365U4F6_9RHOB|nr:glycosyltransferase family A protein [Rhodosalinus halophilus]RBI82791.1 hypothetical protein DRV85_18045 [Rhodosalinus halophilus]
MQNRSTSTSVSIVVATHNRAALLAETLGAIAAQRHRPLEVLVVDDGSTDATEDVVARAAASARRAEGPEIRYLRQGNAGPAAARNRGLAAARGAAVLFSDDDDVMAPGAVAALAAALEAQPAAGIACAAHAAMAADGTPDPRIRRPEPAEGAQAAAAMIAGEWFVPLHGYLFRRAALEAAGRWDHRLRSQEDDALLLSAALSGARFHAAPRALVFYRQHAGPRRSAGACDLRLEDDVAIRLSAWRRLQREGRLERFSAAFGAWHRRLMARYGELLETLDGEAAALVRWASAQESDIAAPADPLAHWIVPTGAKPRQPAPRVN